jgi:hypothetical protein
MSDSSGAHVKQMVRRSPPAANEVVRRSPPAANEVVRRSPKDKVTKEFSYPNVAGVPYQRSVSKYFTRYRYEKPEMKPACTAKSPPPFAPHQNFVRTYLKGPSYPFGGLFLYHGAGTGKTCAAATIMSRFFYAFGDSDWRVLWVTRRTLKSAVLKALFYDLCLPELRAKVLDNSTEMFETKVGKKKIERLRAAYQAYSKGADTPEADALKSFRRRYVKKLPQQNVITYGDFVRALAKSKTPADFGRALAHDPSGKAKGSTTVQDPLHKTLVIIDEAHNLYNMTDFESDADFVTLHTTRFRPAFAAYGASEPPSFTGLQVVESAIWASYLVSGHESCVIVPLSATPMPSSPLDLLRLMNLLIKDKSRRFPLSTKTTTSALDHYATSAGSLRAWVKPAFTKATNGLISYFSGEKDPRYFAMKKWGELVDVSISQVTMETLYRCKERFPLNGPKGATNRITCYRRAATVSGIRGKTCTIEEMERALTGESRGAWGKRAKAREAYCSAKTAAWLKWLKQPAKFRGSFQPPAKPNILNPPPIKVAPAKAYGSLKCSTAYSFVIDSKSRPFSWKLLKEGMAVYAPKYHALFKTIRDLDKKDMETHGHLFKHCVYCDTSGPGEGRSYGSKLAAAMFVAKGYGMGQAKGYGRRIVFEEPSLVGPPPLTPSSKPMARSFGLLTSSRVFGAEKSDARTRATLAAFNAKSNVHGKSLRFILIDDTYKEGIDLYDVKYFHFMEPPLSTATLRQAVARITRRCGSQGLPYGPQGWNVEVFMYRTRVRRGKGGGGPKPRDRNPYITLYSITRSLFDKETWKAFRLLDEFEKLAQGNAVDRLLNEAVVNFKPRGKFIDAIGAGTEVIEGKVPSAV